MNLELVKVIGLLNEAVYSYLRTSKDCDDNVLVDLEYMADLFKMKSSGVGSIIANLSFLGLLFKNGNCRYHVKESMNNNIIYGKFKDSAFVPCYSDKEATLLHSIVYRCCTDTAYNDVTWSENFSDVEYFRAWCLKQIGYREFDANNEVFQIDNDLLSPYNRREYSEDNCVFLPRSLNSVLTRKGSKQELPTGVSFIKDPTKTSETKKVVCEKYLINGEHGEQSNLMKHYAASITRKGVAYCLGRFSTAEAAYAAYTYAKKIALTELAEELKGQIDQRAYHALCNFDLSKLKKE